MIGGLIGGLIGGIAAWLALTYLVAPDVGAEVQALRARVEQLDGRIGSAKADSQALAQLSSRVQTLETARPAPSEQTQAGGQTEAGPGLAALEQRVGALEQSVSAAAGSAAATGQGDLQTRLSAVESQLAGLATDIAGAGDAATGDAATLEALQSRLSAVESQLSGASAGALGDRIQALGAKVDALEPTGAKVTQLAGNLQQLQEQSGASRSQLDQLSGQVQGLDGQIQGLHGNLEDLQGQFTAAQNRAAAAVDRRELAAALALITTQIDTALGRAQAYDAPLRSLTALGDQDEVVRQAAAELAPSAATGVPSLTALRQSFAPVAGEIVQRARAPEGDSLIDQAAGNLMRLVTVRPVGADVEGEDAAARVARAEADLGQGDLAAAVAELERLQGPAAEAAAGWLAEAKTRLRATAALARLQGHTTDLLTQPAN